MQTELDRSTKKNEILQHNNDKEMLRFKKDYDSLFIEKNKLNFMIDNLQVKIKKLEKNSNSAVINTTTENDSNGNELNKSRDEILLNEKLNLSLIEINKLKSDMKSQYNINVTAEMVRREEILSLQKDKEKLIETNNDIKSKLNILESKITEINTAHTSELERILALQNSQAQIAAAQLRINFSTDKRKFKEELSSLNKKLIASEKQMDGYKNATYELENKIKDSSNVSSIGAYLLEEKIIQFLKSRNLYDSSIHNNGNMAKTGSWFELFRNQSENEILKINALKKCLQRFNDKLNSDESRLLLSAGIEL